MNLDRVEKLVKLFHASRVRELTVDAEGWQISMQRGPGGSGAAASGAGTEGQRDGLAELETDGSGLTSVVAPLVGIFRYSNGHMSVGDTVEIGATVGTIESMKIPNPVVAEAAGRVVEVLIEDGQPVEFGQPLYLLSPLPPSPEEEEA